ncbi:hypothetical protein GQ43DRAFT_445435 [Delitschia confertaspora ATCC 74209]|uniref:Uncharacterized protein n=1 Tax=Delitschia confertaspora ATCC 74209 TaxID=1513339 RepID=A0A9P4JDY8_9PLEO|nr:hypothetical protein GQ43DRAFT_445435 [Delitschia confertaspora ATCC 74209]
MNRNTNMMSNSRNTELSEWAQDANFSGTKIDPLKSPMKVHSPHSDEGVIGEDRDIEHAHLQPLDSVLKHHHHHTAPHANSQGSVGREDVIEDSKIEPLDGKYKHTHPSHHTMGLDDEMVDKSRIMPMGRVEDED